MIAIWAIPVYFAFNGNHLELRSGIPPVNLDGGKRLTRKLIKDNTPVLKKPSPLVEALKYAEVLKEPSVVSRTQVAVRFDVSRARVCQMLNLLNLDKRIKEHLLSIKDLKEHNFFTERKLRDIAIMKDKSMQINEFKKLFASTQKPI